jgi:CHAT domain-containing protein
MVTGNIAPGPDCLDKAEWVRVAAGLVADNDTKERMKHAAQCGHCGPLLRAAAETLSDEVTLHEEALLANLSSASSGWQSQMARVLRQSAESQRKSKQSFSWLRGFVWRQAAVAAAAAVAVVAVWFGIRIFRPSSAEQLLAQAYTQRRTFEVRIPGAKYAPLRVERGIGGSNLDKPASLLRAEALIGEHLQKSPNDPGWLQARARADLLDGNYDPAIKALQRALEVQPDSPQLLTDLGSAYYLRAKATGRAIDYGNAVEALGRSLAKAPDDPIALFNRALACEQTFLYVQAVDDWEHYLRIDPGSDWAAEARQRLTALRERIKEHGQGQAQPLGAPAVVGIVGDNLRQVLIDPKIEDYASLGVTKWLPEAYPANSRSDDSTTMTKAALGILADVEMRKHNDPWLVDLLSGGSARDFPRAVEDLSKAILANDKADTDAAHKYATQAASLFGEADNTAGLLRSRLEYLIASNIDQDGQGCQRAAKGLTQATKRPYHWLLTQVHLEIGSCLWLQEDLGIARQEYLAAGQEAMAGSFRAAYLRSQDHLSGLQAASGDFASAWLTAWRGLASFWSGDYPDVRGYNFYYNFYESSRMGSLPHLQVAAWRDGVRLVESSPDIAQRAMAHLLMADAAEAADMSQIAEKEFARASDLFGNSPQSESTRLARLEAEVRLAGVEAKRGNSAGAVDRLRSLRSVVENLPDNFLAIMFYTNLGEAEASSGDSDQAETELRIAVGLAERQLRTMRDDKSRLEVVRQSSGAFRALVQRQLLAGNSEEALSLWERYRGAPLRFNDPAESSPLSDATVPPDTPNLTRYLPSLAKETVVSYALLPRGLAVWVADDRGVFAHWVDANPADVVAMATRFRALCADPTSDQSELEEHARALYDLLVLPIRHRLMAGRVLVTELDEGLDGLPFEALLDEHGRYLSDQGPIATSLGIYYSARSRIATPITADAPALIVAVTRSGASVASQVSPLPEVLTEGETVASNFRAANLLEEETATRGAILSQLSRAVLFHFAGHGLNTSQEAGILASDALITPSSLRRTSLSRMRLAVFSACNTQDGPDDGFSGADSLVRVFLREGVPSVVASRWNVDSVATRQFIELFYRALLAGDSVVESVRQAENALRSHPGTAHPYYWAAFNTFGTS